MLWPGVALGLAILLGVLHIIKSKASPLVWKRCQRITLAALGACLLYLVWLIGSDIVASKSRYQNAVERIDLLYRISAQGCGAAVELRNLEQFESRALVRRIHEGAYYLELMDRWCEEYGPPTEWEIQTTERPFHFFKEGLPVIVIRGDGLKYSEVYVLGGGAVMSYPTPKLITDDAEE